MTSPVSSLGFSGLHSPLSSSLHVELLRQHQVRRASGDATAAAAAAVVGSSPCLHELAPSPHLSPVLGNQSPTSPSTSTASSTAAIDVESELARVLPLPPVWSQVRARVLALPSERRLLSSLQIDPSEARLLRRGLYIACATMYLPELIVGEAVASVASISAVGGAAADGSLVPEPLEHVVVPKSFQVSVVLGGITNQLYKCSLVSHPEQPVLVRIYGPRTELVIDRSKENDVMDVLSANGGGPRVHGRFENGRLESWLVGSSCTPEQMRDPHLSTLIAASVARLHVQPMPFARESVIGETLRKWSEIAASVDFPDAPLKQAQLDQLDLATIIDTTRKYIADVAQSHYGANSELVFAHNDLLSGNVRRDKQRACLAVPRAPSLQSLLAFSSPYLLIAHVDSTSQVMYDESRDSVALVDFEYGNYNPRGFDLANHFCECCGFDCDWSVFPSADAQLSFIRSYLATRRGMSPVDVSDLECRELYAEVQCWLLAPHLFWCLWAVVQAKYSPITFDYLSYAHQRWDGFQKMREQCDAWRRKTRKDVVDSLPQAAVPVPMPACGDEEHSDLTVVQLMSRFASSLRFEDLATSEVHHAVRYLADSLACALAAVDQKEIAQLRTLALQHRVDDGGAFIWGTTHTCAPAYAALVNSSMTRCLDANDLYIPRPPLSTMAAGHCSDALGGVLALVDPERNSGQQLLTAIVIAYEIQAALASCLTWLDVGFHSLSQINFAVPASAAAFPQYGLTPEILSHAIALSGTSGLCANTWLKHKSAPKKPTESKSNANDSVPSIKFVSTGLASQRGIDSLQLAQIGITANADALETILHFFHPDKERPAKLSAFRSLGREFTMDRHLIKQYAAQFNLQAAIAAALDLYAQGVRATDVASLTVHGHQFVCAGVQGSAAAFSPTSQGSADHSTPYVIWVALTHGAFTPALAYGEEHWLRDEVRAQLARVTLVVDEEFERPRRETGRLGCRVTATFSDGRVLSAVRIATAGHPDLPLSDAEVRAKMSSLLTPRFGDDMAARLWNACEALVDSNDTRATKQLLALLARTTTRVE